MAQPAQIVAGIGCRRDTSVAEIVALLEAALQAADLSASALVAIATLERKAGEPGLIAAAARFGVPLRIFPADQLSLAQTVPSPNVHVLLGIHSVAEAAARLAGPLILPKQKSARATCALADAGPDFDLANFGQAVAAPVSTAAMAASRSLTSNAGP